MLWELFPQEMKTDVLLFIIGPPTADQNIILLTLVRGSLTGAEQPCRRPTSHPMGKDEFCKDAQVASPRPQCVLTPLLRPHSHVQLGQLHSAERGRRVRCEEPCFCPRLFPPVLQSLHFLLYRQQEPGEGLKHLSGVRDIIASFMVIQRVDLGQVLERWV